MYLYSADLFYLYIYLYCCLGALWIAKFRADRWENYEIYSKGN